jgi:hypothetical protein
MPAAPRDNQTAPAAASAPSLLDPLETTVEPPSNRSSWGVVRESPDPARAAFHATWEKHRDAIYRTLASDPSTTERAARFAACGSAAWVLRSPDEPGRYRVVANRCHDRFCLRCQQTRARRLAAALLEALPDEQLRFVTLTIRHSEDPLAKQIDHLLRSFRRLRQRRWWKERVPGGVGFLEVKRSRDGNAWHPHLHLIVCGSYLPHAELSAEWRIVTRGSFIVDVRAVDNRDKVRRYVTDYASKPMSYACTRTPEVLSEALAALKNRRLMLRFGSFPAPVLPEPERLIGWQPVGSLNGFVRAAAAGSADALSLLHAVGRSHPWIRPLLPANSPEPPPSRSVPF